MSIDQCLSLSEHLEFEPAPTEADFHRLWQAHFSESYTPEQLAFMGGYLADRLAWLFVSGYQSAIRRSFSVPDCGWAALAVSEDRSSENPLPGLQLQDGLLSGNKTWVAACGSIRHLIVTTAPDALLFRASPPLDGLTIEPKSGVSFLSEMSQGIARFEGTRVTALEALDARPLKAFARREPLYLYLAFSGFLHRINQTNLPLMEGLLRVASDETDAMAVRQHFARLNQLVSEVFNDLPPSLFSGNYDADKGLMALYSKGIQRRAVPRPD